MTKVLDDYFQGLYYYDVPVSHTHIKIHELVDSTKASDSSEEALIAHTYAGNNYKAIKVNPWVNDNEPRKIYYWDTVPCNSGQLAAILSHIESCESSYSSGYNAYPQLMDLFVDPSTFDGNTQVNDKEVPTTITNKLNMLEKMYNTEYSDSLDCCSFTGYTNSELIEATVLNNFHDGERLYPITRVTPVVNGSPVTGPGLGNYLINYNVRASTNYGIGTDGDVALYVEEKNRAWATGAGGANDQHAVSAYLSSEVNTNVVFGATYNKMVDLFADILVRYCKDTLIWFNDKAATEAHEANNLAPNEMLLTKRNWYSTHDTDQWLGERMGDLAVQVTIKAKRMIAEADLCGTGGGEIGSSEEEICTFDGYTNSSLATYVNILPEINYTHPKTDEIKRITPMVSGDEYLIEGLRNIYLPGNTSVNYGIGTYGTIGLFVNEEDRAHSTGSGGINDHKAVTIALASAGDAQNTISDTVFEQLVNLSTDICQRYCKKRLVFVGTERTDLDNYVQQDDELVISLHGMFSDRALPSGDLISKLPTLVNEVNARLAGGQSPQPLAAPRFTNSPLVEVTHLSANNSGLRPYRIDRITPHCVVGQLTAAGLGVWFDPTIEGSSQNAASNYGIGRDGEVGMYVEEKNISWCSSNTHNDSRAITIECASDTTAPFAMYEVVYQSLENLCFDICSRYGKTELLWLGDDKATTENYRPLEHEMLISVHRWYNLEKSCPGDWLVARLPALASNVTTRLQAA